MKMNEDEILEFTYRSPGKRMTNQEKIKKLEKLKLEVMARNPVGLMIPLPTPMHTAPAFAPLSKTPVVLDPQVFNPRKGIMTRYGKKLLEEGAKFYGKLTVNHDGTTKI